MVVWLLTLLGGYLVQRGVCHLGAPSDCLTDMTYLEWYTDLTSLLLYGLVLGWCCGIMEEYRFSWVFSLHQWYLALTFFSFPPMFSMVSEIPWLQFSLDGSLKNVTLAFVVLSVPVGLVVWHIYRAWTYRCSMASFMAYVAPRIFIAASFIISIVVLVGQEGDYIHIHHIVLGWGLALWADRNRMLSGLTLAAGCGLFVQGLGAYSFAPMFLPGGCFDTEASRAATCSFKDPHANYFTLRICPSLGSVSHACRYPARNP